MNGFAYVIVHPTWLERLKTRPDLITIHREDEFDDGTRICYVESPLLRTGNNGTQVVAKVKDDPLEIRFYADIDT